ncbi:hypothetical protein BDA96_04G268900 [Sorghum bicolor]|uniref:Uncharacterized protein n=2 Tax=Sorghum bicolor TaxID=4558 RepID=A0A921UJD6_SORBI|nr:hypothetical protein BDA96_04G268900 [Sorghum bicolor]OQU85473.1 hypothetical protein SORBI_3004G252300 [Sorghum bicolor]
MRYQKNGRRYEALGRSSPTARPCDGCHAVQSVVYCHSDAKCLCVSRDKQVHSANQVAERAHVCEVCKSASTVLTCCADAPALCTTCDAKLHSANTLSQRHQRVPVLPLPAAAIQTTSSFDEGKAFVITHGIKEEEEEVDSWLLLTEDSDYSNCTNSTATANNNRNKKMGFGDVDQYFDLSGYNPYYHSNITRNPEEQYMQEQQQIQRRYLEKEWNECAVPSQLTMVYEQQQSVYGIGGAKNAVSVTSSISLSSMEAGIVPDNTIAGISNLNILTTGGVDLLPVRSFQMPVHLSPRDRAARILRYKEKRQARNFNKTIRYATRKAYAQARPRIKGRFTKISDVELKVDLMSSPPDLPNSSYGTVPWF